MQEYTAYLIPNYVKTNTYMVDHDGKIEYIFEENNVPKIGNTYHGYYDICWDLSQLTYEDDIPEYYECVFAQIDDHNFRLVSFTK